MVKAREILDCQREARQSRWMYDTEGGAWEGHLPPLAFPQEAEKLLFCAMEINLDTAEWAF